MPEVNGCNESETAGGGSVEEEANESYSRWRNGTERSTREPAWFVTMISTKPDEARWR
jgi:hypothetical protein